MSFIFFILWGLEINLTGYNTMNFLYKLLIENMRLGEGILRQKWDS